METDVLKRLIKLVTFDTLFCVLMGIIVPVSTSDVEGVVSINRPIGSHPPWVHFSADYVRCFCNLPVCVSTGYMCKSKEGVCFSDLHEHAAPILSGGYRGRHGCLELLPDSEQRIHCRRSSEENASGFSRKKLHPRSLLVCCNHDMCNHVDSPQTKTLLNSTLLGDLSNSRDRILEVTGNQQDSAGYTSSEIWFKAATIAVPICGAVILFVLIALAVRILRSEHQNSSSRKLGAMCVTHNKFSPEKYHEHLERILRAPHQSSQSSCYYMNHTEDVHRQIQVPLLVQNEITTHHSGSKNETNAKLNLMHCENVNEFLESGKSLIEEIEKKVSPKCSQVNLDVNISGKYNDKYTEDDKYAGDANLQHDANM